MSQYMVTIAPVTGGAPSTVDPQMVALVEIVNGQSQIVELTMRAAEGSALVKGVLPVVDLDLLARAITAPFSEDGDSEPSGEPVRRQPAHGSTRAGASRTPARAVSKPAAPAKRAAKSGDLDAPRVYRRMPDPVELQRAYEETGSIIGVAKRFDVPAHTAQGWIGRLRRRSADRSDS
jgi:hypothetical protein